MSELVTLEKPKLADLFKVNEGIVPVLEEIKKICDETPKDMTTKKGRDAIISLAAKVSKSKTYLDDIGKESVEDLKAAVKAVDNERKRARDFLDNLRDAVRKPVTDFEEAEKERVNAIHKKLAWFDVIVNTTGNSDAIQKALDEVKTEVITQNFYDSFYDTAVKTKELAIESLSTKLKNQIKYENEQKELEEFRRIQKENEEKAEALRKEQELREKIEQENKEKLERAEKEKRDAELALELANKKALEDAEKAKKEATEREERLAKEKEEGIKKALEQEALRLKKEKEDQEAQELAREKDLKHKKKINNEVLEDLFLVPELNGLNIPEIAIKGVIKAIAQGKIRNVKITY